MVSRPLFHFLKPGAVLADSFGKFLLEINEFPFIRFGGGGRGRDRRRVGGRGSGD